MVCESINCLLTISEITISWILVNHQFIIYNDGYYKVLHNFIIEIRKTIKTKNMTDAILTKLYY